MKSYSNEVVDTKKFEAKNNKTIKAINAVNRLQNIKLSVIGVLTIINSIILLVQYFK